MPVSAPTSPARPRNERRTYPTTFQAVCAEISHLRHHGLTWRAIAGRYRLPDGKPINFATLRYIHKTQREPRRADIRRALGLREYVSVPACAHCGEAHISRRCPRMRPRTRLSVSGRRMTVGVWVEDYEAWRRMNMAEIENILE